MQEAEEFLTGLMHDGKIEMPPDDIVKRAAAGLIGKAAIKRAKDNLGLISRKEGFPAVVVAWELKK